MVLAQKSFARGQEIEFATSIFSRPIELVLPSLFSEDFRGIGCQGVRTTFPYSESKFRYLGPCPWELGAPFCRRQTEISVLVASQ